MALDLKINFETGKIENLPVSGKERILQQIKIATRIFKGNWELDDNYGNSFFEGSGKAILLSEIREMIDQVDGVISIQSINISEIFDTNGKGEFTIDALIQLDSELIKLEKERIA